jgi:hypothetical protein
MTSSNYDNTLLEGRDVAAESCSITGQLFDHTLEDSFLLV